MVEEEKKEEIKPETPKEEKKELVENNPLDKIRKENAELETELAKRDAMMARLSQGGRSLAGQAPVITETPEQKASKERVKKIGMATGAKWAKEMK